MWIQTQMFAIIEERYNEVTCTNNIRQMSSIKTDALMYSVHNACHYTDMTGDTMFLSSDVPSLRLCKSTELVWNIFLFKQSCRKVITNPHIGRTAWPRNVATKVAIFGKVSKL
jgi:hypothetical protein